MMTRNAITLLLMLAAAAAGSAQGPALTILCSTTQIADFARNVAGDRCQVWCVLAPGADPHTYQPTPADAQRAIQADLCLQNGLHLEGKNWMEALAGDAGKPVVTCTDGIEALQLDDPGGEYQSDPHAWFSPKNAAVYVNNITRALLKLDPDGRWEYEARARLYLQQLRVLEAWVRETCNAVPPEQRVLVTSHDAFNYFARDFGFRHQAPVGWSTGAETGGGMTPERRRQVVESIRGTGVKAIFVETSVNPKLIREIAAEAGVTIGGELYSDSMGEAGTAGETYIGMMRENVLRIVSALK
jgi:manganese/iron transport system substrate-binding protein